MPFLFTCFIFQTDISLLILRLDQSVGIPLTLVNYIHLILSLIHIYDIAYRHPPPFAAKKNPGTEVFLLLYLDSPTLKIKQLPY